MSTHDPGAHDDLGTADPRTRDLAANLRDVERRIDEACRAAGRARADVTLIVVTKTWPVEDVRRLASLGVREVGENRDQEAAPKAAATVALDLRWHFVGRLQTNKARSVASYADVVHALDRPRVVDAIGAGAVAAGRTVDGLIQVSLEPGARAGESSAAAGGRGGAAPEDLLALADRIERTDGLRLAGVMAVAPLGTDPVEAFERLAGIAADLRRAHPGAGVVSAGMSSDLGPAIAAGATHVRVGTAVLGERPPLG